MMVFRNGLADSPDAHEDDPSQIEEDEAHSNGAGSGGHGHVPEQFDDRVEDVSHGDLRECI
jgi:hypothetical protein